MKWVPDVPFRRAKAVTVRPPRHLGNDCWVTQPRQDISGGRAPIWPQPELPSGIGAVFERAEWFTWRQGEDAYEVVLEQGDMYDPTEQPELLKELARLHEADREGVGRFYRKWGRVRTAEWLLSRDGIARPTQPEAMAATEDGPEYEYAWQVKRESYRLDVAYCFAEGIARAAGQGKRAIADKLLRGLYFAGVAERLPKQSDEYQNWLRHVMRDPVYGACYRDWTFFKESKELISGDGIEAKTQELIIAASYFIQRELQRAASGVRIIPYVNVTFGDREAGSKGRFEPEPPLFTVWSRSPDTVAQDEQAPLLPAFQYDSLLTAAYMMLYDQLTGSGRYALCLGCGNAFARGEVHRLADGKSYKSDIYCHPSCGNTHRMRIQRNKSKRSS